MLVDAMSRVQSEFDCQLRIARSHFRGAKGAAFARRPDRQRRRRGCALRHNEWSNACSARCDRRSPVAPICVCSADARRSA